MKIPWVTRRWHEAKVTAIMKDIDYTAKAALAALSETEAERDAARADLKRADELIAVLTSERDATLERLTEADERMGYVRRDVMATALIQFERWWRQQEPDRFGAPLPDGGDGAEG